MKATKKVIPPVPPVVEVVLELTLEEATRLKTALWSVNFTAHSVAGAAWEALAEALK